MEQNNFVPPFSEELQEVSEYERELAEAMFISTVDDALQRHADSVVASNLPDSHTGIQLELPLLSSVIPYESFAILVLKVQETSYPARLIMLTRLGGRQKNDSIEYLHHMPDAPVVRTNYTSSRDQLLQSVVEEKLGRPMTDSYDQEALQIYAELFQQDTPNQEMARQMGLADLPMGLTEMLWLAHMVGTARPMTRWYT